MTPTKPPPTEFTVRTIESTKEEAPELRVGIIGTGLMAKSHTVSFMTARSFFGVLPPRPKLAVICGESEDLARKAAKTLGFEHWTTNWQNLVDDPSIDLLISAQTSKLQSPAV
jgi:predicted dehydrogenase